VYPGCIVRAYTGRSTTPPYPPGCIYQGVLYPPWSSGTGIPPWSSGTGIPQWSTGEYYTHHGARESTIPTMVLGIHHPPWSSGYTTHHGTRLYTHQGTRLYTHQCIPGRYTPLYTRQVHPVVYPAGTPVVYPAYTPLLIPGMLLLGTRDAPTRVPGMVYPGCI